MASVEVNGTPPLPLPLPLPTGRRRGAGARRGLLLVCLFVAVGCGSARSVDQATQRVEVSGRVFHLELALDPEARYQGLSDRPQVAPDGGMLFVFPRPGILQFVMRRCLVPIDIIFLDPAGRVVATHAMRVEPAGTPEEGLFRYSSRWPAQFVIELAGGTVQGLDLAIGQRIGLPIETLKSRAR